MVMVIGGRHQGRTPQTQARGGWWGGGGGDFHRISSDRPARCFRATARGDDIRAEVFP